jgi:hypothetical protein
VLASYNDSLLYIQPFNKLSHFESSNAWFYCFIFGMSVGDGYLQTLQMYMLAAMQQVNRRRLMLLIHKVTTYFKNSCVKRRKYKRATQAKLNV